MSDKLLDVRNLSTYFYTSEGTVKAVNDVSFHIKDGETLALVGESGCGKSVTSLSIMGLIPWPPGKIVAGEIEFQGSDLLKLNPSQIQKIRGNEISMIFQEPMTSLNPVYTIGFQISEALMLHQNMNTKEANNKAVKMLEVVGIPEAEKRVKEYPHQLSGGMRQRAMIAMALACNPRLLIADEPTTALDVTIQAQILDLLRKLKEELGMAILLITHDLGVVAEMAQRVVVMYAGKIVEEADVISIFKDPYHPYTKGLLDSIPKLDGKAERLHVINGVVPNPAHMPQGCSFQPRCPMATEQCSLEEPPLRQIGERLVACWNVKEGEGES